MYLSKWMNEWITKHISAVLCRLSGAIPNRFCFEECSHLVDTNWKTNGRLASKFQAMVRIRGSLSFRNRYLCRPDVCRPVGRSLRWMATFLKMGQIKEYGGVTITSLSKSVVASWCTRRLAVYIVRTLYACVSLKPKLMCRPYHFTRIANTRCQIF